MAVSCATTVLKICHVYKTLAAPKNIREFLPAVNRGIAPLERERESAVDCSTIVRETEDFLGKLKDF